MNGSNRRKLIVKSVVVLLLMPATFYIIAVIGIYWGIPYYLRGRPEYPLITRAIMHSPEAIARAGRIYSVTIVPLESTRASTQRGSVVQNRGNYCFRVRGEKSDFDVCVDWDSHGNASDFKISLIP